MATVPLPRLTLPVVVPDRALPDQAVALPDPVVALPVPAVVLPDPAAQAVPMRRLRPYPPPLPNTRVANKEERLGGVIGIRDW